MTLLANLALSLAEGGQRWVLLNQRVLLAFKRWTGQRPAIAALKSGSPGVVV